MLAQNIEEIKNKIQPRIIAEKNNTFPKTILIDNISHCNLRCNMCPHKSMKRTKGIMEWDIYRKIIDEIAERDPSSRVWITFFGEGLLLPDLPERIEYGKSKGLHDIVLNSNGTMLNKERSKKLISSGLDALYVGIDAFESDTYEKIRVGGNITKTIEGVLQYKAILDELGSEKQKVFVQFVEMDINRHQMDDFIKFWTGHGIPVKIRPMVSWAGKTEAANLKEYVERLPCNWAINSFNIANDGKVCLCAVDLDCEVVMGDIRFSTIYELWNSVFKEFRINHLNGNYDKLNVFCRNCNDWQSSYAEYVNIC